jgi:hypothetical protein
MSQPLPKIVTRALGKNGPQVPRLGLGLMGLSGHYGLPAPDEERLAFLDKAYEMGERFWDTGESRNDILNIHKTHWLINRCKSRHVW